VKTLRSLCLRCATRRTEDTKGFTKYPFFRANKKRNLNYRLKKRLCYIEGHKGFTKYVFAVIFFLNAKVINGLLSGVSKKGCTTKFPVITMGGKGRELGKSKVMIWASQRS
jgi:hypothetical protein